MNPGLIFPKNRFRTTNLSNAPQTVVEGGRPIGGFRIIGGAAAEIVIFRAFGGASIYFQVPVAIGAYVESPLKWYPEDGLEILTATAAGDVEVVVHYT